MNLSEEWEGKRVCGSLKQAVGGVAMTTMIKGPMYQHLVKLNDDRDVLYGLVRETKASSWIVVNDDGVEISVPKNAFDNKPKGFHESEM